MKIGVFGAGSIGCYLGGRLAAAGQDVVFVGRLRSEIEEHGLTLTDHEGARVVLAPERVRYVDDPGALDDRDVVFVTVKSPATPAAGAALASTRAVVVSFQNGVRNVDTLRELLPGRAVLAGMVPFNVVHQRRGSFHNGTSGPLEVERVPAALVQALESAGFGVTVHDDLRPVQWSKLLVNLNNSLNALAGVPLREQLSDRGYRSLMADLVREGLAVLRAAGIRPVRVGRLIPSIAPVALGLPDWLFFRVAAAMVKIDPTARSSMWEDLERRRGTEVEFLNGEVIRLGEQRGVSTPLNVRVRDLVRAAERAGRGSPGLSAAAIRSGARDTGGDA